MASAAGAAGAGAGAANGEVPTEEGGSLSLRPVADRLLLACCRAIKKQTGWQHRTLRAACDWATGELVRNQHPGLGLSRYYRVVELGMESNSEDVVEEALGQLHKLIAGGLVRRDTVTTLKDGSSANLADILVDMVLLTGSKDKTVRRGGRAQAVKCLLSCVTSPEIQIHGEQLRRVYSFVRETFLIIDSTANRARHNKAQARATLDHILQVTFSRLEMEESLPQSFHGHPSPQARAIKVLVSPQTGKTSTVSPSAAAAALVAAAESLEKEGSTNSELGAEGSVPPTASSAAGSEGVATAVRDALVKIEKGSASDGADLDDISPGGGEAGGGEGIMVETAVAIEGDVEGEMQLDEEERAEDGLEEEESDGAESAPTVAQSDALMLLTDLCKWSLADERNVGGDESVARLLESKTMALELIVAVLRTYGGARFRALPAAISLVRGELCPALLHHCTSGVTEMVSLSLRVFVALVKGFKNHLKAEVEVFITSIFLRILESEHSAFDHKMLVLEAISGLCRDPVALVEMFVNYDCDLEAIDLFKRIMTALTKVAKGRSMTAEAAGKKELEEERSLQLRGMAGTVDVVASMVKAADLEELEGEMAMAPRLDSRRVHTNSITPEVAPSLSPVRTISSTPVGIPAISSSSSPRRDCATATSSSKATHTGPTSGTQAQGVTTATAPGDQSGGGPADARASTSAPLSNTWSGGPASASSGAEARRSRRGFSFALGVGAGGGGDEVARGRPVSGRGRRGSLRVDGQTQGEALQAFDTKRRVQREIEAGIIKFNQKPKEGLAYLHSKGHLISSEPASVASFLREQSQRLDKTEVGEFLGRGADYMGGFCVKVLHAYVDGMDFTDMLFDEAIRHFLSGFRLPGEAQKIDRMMEKFAERFCLQNASVFPNPDTAFILAFSIVMLNTDLHNPSIPDAKRMTKEGFIKNNRGIDQGESLPDEFLGGVYDRIARSPISLKEDDQLRRVVEGGSSATYSLQEMLPFSGASSARRLAAHDREREEMLKSSRALLRRQRAPLSSTNRYTLLSMAGGDDVLVSPDIVDHVWLMYEITWGPLLAVFSEVLESSDDSELIEQCLEGLKKAVRIAGGLDMTMARETLINALVRFTLLETSRHMEDKNVRCVKVLLCLALTDGNLLRESWGPVLRCISQLSRLQLFARDLQQDGLPLGFNDAEPPPRKVKDSVWKPGGAGAEIDINGSRGSGKLPAATMVPNPAESDKVVTEVEAKLGERNADGAGDEGSAVAMSDIIAEEKEGRDGEDGGGDEEEYATEDSTTTTTTAVTATSTDWLSDLKSALGVTSRGSAGRGGGATKGSGREIVGGGSGGAMEQVMSYFKERDALLNDRRRREREKAMGELATFFMGPSREEKVRMVEERNAAAVMGQIDQALIDRVFSATRMLNREAMQHFVEQLIQVSRSEIPQLSGRRSGALGGYQRHEGGAKGGSSTGGGGGGTASAASKPRVFSMQKLVEIAHLNMDVRSRIEWAGLWGALAEHLGTVGSMSGGTSVAMYTVDCLRQLALKFLDKDELRDFNFQRIFMGPFATIFRNSREAAIRELVVSCLNVVILTKGPLIRSGWKTVLSVLRAAARDTEEDVVQPASLMLARLSGEQFPLVQYDFVDLVHALLEMAASRFPDVSLECMGHLWSCARELGEGRVDVALQRPLLEATVSNTGQLPREVLDAAIADRGEAGAGAGAGAAVARAGHRKRRAFDHLTLDVDALEETACSGSAGSLKAAPGNDDNHDSALPALGEKHSSSVASGDSVTRRVSQRSGESAMTSKVTPAVGSFGSARLALRLWWPLLTGLARRVGDPRLDCRAASLSTLRDILREYGSAPEFSVRVWPFILTHVLLPASRDAKRIFPLSVPPEVPPEMSAMATPSSSSTPSIQDRASPAAAPATSPRNVGFGSKHQPSSPSTVFLCPASRSVLPLDVRSWMHTTAPQLFRAAAIVVAGNAKGAAPLGLPTLMSFLEPHVCCRHGSGRVRPGRRRRLSWPPLATDVDRDEAENENTHRKKRRESQPEKRNIAAAVTGAGWAGEIEAAAAAGALLAEEAGVTGTGLMSRIALESLGLLVEGLVGQQVPQDVLSFMCDSLVRMMRRCLPGVIGSTGHSVYGTTIPTLPSPMPRSKGDGEAGGSDGVVLGAKCDGGGGDVNACRESDAVGAREMDSLDDADGGGGGEGGGRNSDGDWAVSRGKEPGRGEAGDDLAGSSALGFSAVKIETSQGTGNSKGTLGFANLGSVSFPAPVASAPGCDHLILDDDAESVTDMRSEAVDTFLCPTPEAQPPAGGSSTDEEDVRVDGERAAMLLAAALRLERLLYGLARLHLRALGEDGARVLLGGLSEGVRYARAFHSQLVLRTSLFSDGVLVPRSGPRSRELPHLLELESEGLCYIFSVAFRLLGVRWPRSPPPPSAIANNSAGADSIFDSGQSTTIGWTSLWPNRHAFEPPPSAYGGVVGGVQRERHQRQIRPPRAGPDFGGRETEASVRAPYNVPTYHRTPTLVVDDLLDWGGEGDMGPRDGNDAAGEAAGSSSDRGSTRGPSWDGTALSREFLRNEGSALLKRYFVADGGLQRGRLENGALTVEDEAPVSPVSISSLSSSRPASGTALSIPGGEKRGESGLDLSARDIPPGGEGGRGKVRQERSTGNMAPQAPRIPSSHRPVHAATSNTGYRSEAVDLVATWDLEVRRLTPAVLLLLRGLLLLELPEEFAWQASWVYPCLADLVVVRSLEVRAAVRELLLRFAPLLSLSDR